MENLYVEALWGILLIALGGIFIITGLYLKEKSQIMKPKPTNLTEEELLSVKIHFMGLDGKSRTGFVTNSSVEEVCQKGVKNDFLMVTIVIGVIETMKEKTFIKQKVGVPWKRVQLVEPPS